MSNIPPIGEKYSGQINEIPLGKGDFVAGGAKGMPFLSFENPSKRRPMVAGEVFDTLIDYPELAKKMFSGRETDPVEWATMWKELGVDMICLRLISTDPEKGNTPAEKAAELVQKISDKTDLPIIVSGCGIVDIDVNTLTVIAERITNTKLILSKTDENEYKRLSEASKKNGHTIIAFSNLDINLAKQINILLSDYGVDGKNILTDPLMAALGMGLDYSYSVNERIRIAALNGDGMLQNPVICDCTAAWDVNDATCDDDGTMGDALHRATWWETITALAAMISGSDIVIIRGAAAADMTLVYAKELTEVL